MEFNLKRAIEVLSQTPATLDSILRGLSVEWTGGNGESDVWTPFDVVGHLIHGEETDWIPRARIILAQGESVSFEPFDRFAQFEKSKGKSMDELLDQFAEVRKRNIEILESWSLDERQMQLKGMHPELGEIILKQLLATWVVHDLNHIRQIVNGLAVKYADEVGPWKPYLSILQ